MSQPKSNAPNDVYIYEALREGKLLVDPDTGGVFKPDLTVAGKIGADGYVLVCYKRRNLLAHRIVWIALNGPIADGLEINHRNRVRHDNRPGNLEVVTHAENMAHAFETPYYNRVRDEDVEAVDAEWFAQLAELMDRDDVTAEDIAALRPEPRGPIGSPEFTMWHSDQKVDHAFHGRR